MAIDLILKNSTVQDKVPLPTDLEIGELAVNANENSPAIYAKDTAGNIVKFAGTGAVGNDWSRVNTTLSPKETGDVISFSAGTEALPSLTPVGDPNTGLWSPAPDELAASTQGATRVAVDSVGTATLASDDSNPALVVEKTTTEGMRFDEQECLLVGLSSAIGTGGLVAYSGLQVAGVDAKAGISIIRATPAANSVGALTLARSRGTSVNDLAALENGDRIGLIRFIGSDGVNYNNFSATIRAEVDGTPAVGSCPARLIFGTLPENGSSVVPRVTIKSSGIVNFGRTDVYADNADAIANGLVSGDIYRLADGTLMIVF